MGAVCCDASATGDQIDNPAPAGLSRNEDPARVNADIAAESIKLEYFGDCYGRVDPIRQMLEHKGASYKFIGYTQESWGEMKENGGTAHLEMGGLPIAHYGGHQGRQQTMAVLRSLGCAHGFYDPNDWQNAGFIDMVVESYGDTFNAAAKAALFSPEEEKQKNIEAVRDGIAKKLINMVEKRFERNNGQKFAAGDNLTIADFCMASFIFNMLKNEMSPLSTILGPLLDEFPRFAAYAQRLGAELSSHIDSRPKHFF